MGADVKYDSIQSRFFAKVQDTGTCRLWIGSIDTSGYGLFRFEGKLVKAHRFAWYLRHSRFPDLLMCHTCDVRHCVNVDHLFEGDYSENALDMVGKRRHQAVTRPETIPRGEKHPHAKLCEEQVRTIRTLRGQYTIRELGLMFGVSYSIISQIHTGKRWSSV
jgi:hypothetical protein